MRSSLVSRPSVFSRLMQALLRPVVTAILREILQQLDKLDLLPAEYDPTPSDELRNPF